MQDRRRPHNAGDRSDVVDEVEIEFVIERRVDRIRRENQQQRVTVRRCARDRLGCQVGGGARAVLDDERLTEALRQPLTDQPRSDVGAAGRRKADDDSHRSCWIGLCMRDPAGDREGGNTDGQTQKSTARKPHGILLWPGLARAPTRTAIRELRYNDNSWCHAPIMLLSYVAIHTSYGCRHAFERSRRTPDEVAGPTRPDDRGEGWQYG